MGGTAGLFIDVPPTVLCLAPGSFVPLGLRDLRPLLRRPILLIDLLLSPLEDLDERIPAGLRELGGFCGELVGRGPRGTRLALPVGFIPPALLSSGSFFICLLTPKESGGPKLIPAAIAPSRFCNGA